MRGLIPRLRVKLVFVDGAVNSSSRSMTLGDFETFRPKQAAMGGKSRGDFVPRANSVLVHDLSVFKMTIFNSVPSIQGLTVMMIKVGRFCVCRLVMQGNPNHFCFKVVFGRMSYVLMNK